jgi:PAS domain S-box-containing protein
VASLSHLLPTASSSANNGYRISTSIPANNTNIVLVRISGNLALNYAAVSNDLMSGARKPPAGYVFVKGKRPLPECLRGRIAMENEFSLTVDALPGLVWSAMPDGQIVFVNCRWREYTGLSVEQASGQVWQDVIHPDDCEMLLESWRTVVDFGVGGETEARIRRFDGKYRWFLCRVSPVLDAVGHVSRWWGINLDIEDRKRTEAALRAQEAHFRLIVDGLPTRVSLFTPAGKLFHANRHTLEYAGATLDDLKQWANRGFTHPDDRLTAIARFRESIRTGDPYDFESRHRRADGTYRWFRVQGFPLRDSEGRTALWYFLQTDIDDGKRAETLLAEEKCLLEMVAMGQPFSNVLDDVCRSVEQIANHCVGNICLSDPGDMTSQRPASPGHALARSYPSSGIHGRPDHGPCGLAVFLLKESVIVPNIETDLRWSSVWRDLNLAYGGKRKHLETHATPMHDRDGAIVQRGVTHDVTAREQAEEQLRKSAALTAKVEQLSLSGSFCWCPETGSFTCSEQLCRIFGIEPGVNVSLDMITARVHPADLHLLREMIERARDGQDLELDHRLLLPNASIRYVRLRAHATRGPQGLLDYIGAVHDVTERRQSEEALSRLRAELAHVSRVNSLGTLTASIAHEINQPLAGIITNASTGVRMLSAQPPNVESALDTFQRTLRDARRASEIIARLRALFRKKAVTTDEFNLLEAVNDVIELLRSEIRTRRIVLRVEAADNLRPVKGDRIQLQQVALNLLLNAMEAMNDVEDRPRTMLVRIKSDKKDHVQFSVTDSGPGFTPEKAFKLFDAFYTTKRDGMGIGLSVSRSIIDSHGGKLWGTSEQRFGATFAFSIPCREKHRTSMASTVGARVPVHTGSEQIVANL